MTGPEHYAEAERFIAYAQTEAPAEAIQPAILLAQVHATLALTAATAMYPVGITLDGDTARA